MTILQEERICILLTSHPFPNFNAGRATSISVNGRRRKKHRLRIPDLGGRIVPQVNSGAGRVRSLSLLHHLSSLKTSRIVSSKETKEGDLPNLPTQVLTLNLYQILMCAEFHEDRMVLKRGDMGVGLKL